jgi:hypothetical protein
MQGTTLQGTTSTLTVQQPILPAAQSLGTHVPQVASYNWEAKVQHQQMILLQMSLKALVVFLGFAQP